MSFGQTTAPAKGRFSIHDSFVVEEKNKGVLEDVMKEAYLKARFIPDLSKCIPKVKPVIKAATP